MIYEPKEPEDGMLFVVPNELRDAINAKLNAAIAEHPEAAPDREILYSHLLSFFNDNGYIPDFHLSRKKGDMQ